MAIYTKKGDKGTTGLFASNKDTWTIPKDDIRIQTIGAIDEVNSNIGLAISFIESAKLTKILNEVQENLFLIGSTLAGAQVKFYATKTKKLETLIDGMESKLPTLTNFILPGGSKGASFLFNARAIARRAERQLIALNSQKKVPQAVLTYVNRLSDFLFVMGRLVNHDLGVEETIWTAKKGK